MPNIEGVAVTALDRIPTDGGYVMRGLKRGENSFNGFGEAYFSCIESGNIRGWKRHQRMTLNLIVIVGEIRFVLIDGRSNSGSQTTEDIVLSADNNYARLTVPPGIWMGFQGIYRPNSILANIASIEHDPSETDHASLDKFEFDW
jgi:dTDP-4-dehydrorhamnose 3,5-epimerase